MTTDIQLENLGAKVFAAFGQAAAIRTHAGINSVCFISNGTPSCLYEFELFTGKLLHKEMLHGLDCVWGITCTPEGEVYFGGTTDKQLFRYYEHGKLERLGENPSNEWVFNMECDKEFVWGATYPDSKLFSYSRLTGEFKDYGTIAETEHYLRGVARDGDWLLLSTGSCKKVFNLNFRTGEKKEVFLEQLSNEQGFLDQLWYIGDYLFAASDFINLYIYDRQSLKLLTTLSFDNLLLTDHPLDPDLVLYKDGTALRGWHLKEQQIYTIVETGLPAGRCKSIKSIQLNDEDYVALVTVNAEQALIKLSDLSIARHILALEPQPILHTGLDIAPNGKIYMGGYHRGMAQYNPDTDEIEWSVGLFPQNEGTAFYEGKVYFGTYTHAHLYKYDPSKEVNFDWTAEGNPRWIGQVGHKQDRPFAMTAGDGYVFAGTIPDYGTRGGALAVWDVQKNELTTYPGVVEDQSVLGMAYHKGKLFMGTTVWGGLGLGPVDGPAKVFVWDAAARQIIASFVPQVSDSKPLMIGGLTVGSDGLIWAADDGIVFAFNPDTYEIVKSKVIYPAVYEYTKWRPVFVKFGTDGLLYTSLARKIIVVNPETLEHRVLGEGPIGNMGLDKDNRIYYNDYNQLMRITLAGAVFG